MALLPDRAGTDPFLFIGTGAGVFFTPLLNGGNTAWRRFGTGLPDAGQAGIINKTVTDLEITASRRSLLAATWGRGAWSTTILPHTIWHTIRHADSSWQPVFDDVERQALPPGIFTAVCCAGTDSDLQVCGITQGGGMWHTIRHINGSWQPFFGDVKSQAGNPGPFSAVGCAAINGELHVCGVIVTNGGLWHTIRHATGSWQAFGDVKSQAGDPGRLIRVGCAAIGGELHISAVTLA